MNEKPNMTIFDFLPPEPSYDPEDCLSWCATCLFDEKGCCSFNEGERVCVLGDYYEPDFKKFEKFEDVVSYIGNKTGIKFKPAFWELNGEVTEEYEGKFGKCTFDIHLSTYFDSDIPFISFGWKEDGINGGGGGPCDSIREVITTIQRKIRLYAK